MGLFDVDDNVERATMKWEFEERYKNIAGKFKTMFDLPIPLLVEDHKINLEKGLIFTPEPVGLNRENILFYDLAEPINNDEFYMLLDLAFLWTIEGIILNNIDNIHPGNSKAQELITRILTAEDKSGKATFYGNPPTFLRFPSKNFDEKIYEAWNGPQAPGQPRKTGRIKVALICKEFPEYLKDKNIFCSKILMGEK